MTPQHNFGVILCCFCAFLRHFFGETKTFTVTWKKGRREGSYVKWPTKPPGGNDSEVSAECTERKSTEATWAMGWIISAVALWISVSTLFQWSSSLSMFFPLWYGRRTVTQEVLGISGPFTTPPWLFQHLGTSSSISSFRSFFLRPQTSLWKTITTEAPRKSFLDAKSEVTGDRGSTATEACADSCGAAVCKSLALGYLAAAEAEIATGSLVSGACRSKGSESWVSAYLLKLTRNKSWKVCCSTPVSKGSCLEAFKYLKILKGFQKTPLCNLWTTWLNGNSYLNLRGTFGCIVTLAHVRLSQVKCRNKSEQTDAAKHVSNFDQTYHQHPFGVSTFVGFM